MPSPIRQPLLATTVVSWPSQAARLLQAVRPSCPFPYILNYLFVLFVLEVGRASSCCKSIDARAGKADGAASWHIAMSSL